MEAQRGVLIGPHATPGGGAVKVILEEKGFETEQDRQREVAAKRRVRVVNHHGEFGRWAFCVCRGPGRVRNSRRQAFTSRAGSEPQLPGGKYHVDRTGAGTRGWRRGLHVTCGALDGVKGSAGGQARSPDHRFRGVRPAADGSDASAEFRRFLSVVPSDVLARYADECLTGRFDDSGLALQDIINQIGRRLGFQVVDGRYRGSVGQNGYDGLWHSPESHAIVVEVKTTDAYRVDLDAIAGYRRMLIRSGEVTEDRSSILSSWAGRRQATWRRRSAARGTLGTSA